MDKNPPSFILQGYIIRRACEKDLAEIAMVHWKSWQTSYKGIINQTFLDNRSFEDCLNLRKKIFNTKFAICFVATCQDQIVGFVDAGDLRIHENQFLSELQKTRRTEKGEIYALYLLKQHQGKGCGKALFQRLKQEMQEKDLIPFLAWVFKDNFKARGFYEFQGGVIVEETSIKIGSDFYQEVAYKFIDTK